MLHAMGFVLSLVSLTSSQNVIISDFSKESVFCDVDDKIKYGCSREVEKARSFIHCASLCRLDQSCIGASQDGHGKCFLHQECYEIAGCTLENGNHDYLSKYCVHGTWDESMRDCKCRIGFHGVRCNLHYQNCGGLLTAGYHDSAYRIRIDPDQDGKDPLLVSCIIYPPKFRAVNLFINEGRMDFNRSWDDYVGGFYLDDRHFWVGLETWHKLSEFGYNEVVLSFVINDSKQSVIFRQHYGLEVSGIDWDYQFKFKSSTYHSRGSIPSGSYFTCLNYLQNKPFSTWDRDKDGESSTNCASRSGFGWWYSRCNIPCNVFGDGLEYMNDRPGYQIFSVQGWNMSWLSPKTGFYMAYVRNT